MEFRYNLQALRKQHGLTQMELAKALDVSTGLIGMYEAGKRKPSFESLEAIADYFNVTIDYLVGKEERSVYYLDPEVAELAQELHDNPELRMMLHASRKVSKEDMKTLIKMIKGMEE